MFKKLNDKGQVALFVALIFQVLFVFFAMIVNVGLLVHHKINLQNSVDIAAYYGAMKQAEMLNAIGHVNYQIRQSWKLMSFRYGQLGTAGAISNSQHPYAPSNQTGQPGTITRKDDIVWPHDSSFCIPYNPISLVNPTESYCRNAAGVSIPLPGVPSLGPANFFVNFQVAIQGAATAFEKAARSGCESAMASNWLQMAQFIQAYKIDIRNRKKLLLALANEISRAEPNDLEGQPLKKGVFKTLLKNLTYQNQESLRTRFDENGDGSSSAQTSFQFINSLSSGECGGQGGDNSVPGWLSEIYTYPFYYVVDGVCGNSQTLELKPYWMSQGGSTPIPPNALKVFGSTATEIYPYLQEFGTSDPSQLLYRSSLGFEKNPWCVGYVGVSASTTPKIPFTPLGDVTMTATAFAKPFGGRIGPWFNEKWPADAKRSDEGSALTDKVAPVRVEASQNVSNVNPAQIKSEQRATPNHGRYMGDTVGIRSELTMGQFGKAIHSNGTIDLNWYTSMRDEIRNELDQKGENGDILAWNKNQNSSPVLREMEISAISPDQFDVANYSIDPDFYNNYLKKIEAAYGNKYSFLFRGDFGSRMNGSEQEKRFSIRDQIDVIKKNSPTTIDTQSELTYYINEFAQVLTAWQAKSPDEYVIDDARFGKCAPDSEVRRDEEEKFFTMGSCKAGGRTGYSVKLVDGKFLQNEVNGQPQDYELGGKGVFGRIKNPPPSGF